MLFDEDDLHAMMEPFSTEVIVNKGTRAEQCIYGVFDNPSKDYTISDEGFATSVNEPTITVKTVDAALLPIGSVVYVNKKTYRISDINNDESIEGYSVLVLKLK